jgi:soluble lytic murein transglycosylase-like protein
LFTKSFTPNFSRFFCPFRNFRALLVGVLVLLACPLLTIGQDQIPAPSQSTRSTYQVTSEFIEYLSDRYGRPAHEVSFIVKEVLKVAKDVEEAATILGIISVESAFNPKARSQGNVGLMQVNASVHGGQGLADPKKNIEKGAGILREYHAGNLEYTLASYNQGPGNAKRICASKTKCKTKYVQKVLEKRKEFLPFLASL